MHTAEPSRDDLRNIKLYKRMNQNVKDELVKGMILL